MDNEQLCHVAKLIAKRHYFEQTGLPSERIRHYVRMRHEYGLKLAPDSSRTDDGQMARLRSEYFWREQINAVADSHREHLAMQGRQLGDPAKGFMPYCSDVTYQMFETRLEAITSRLSGQQLDLCPGATKASENQTALPQRQRNGSSGPAETLHMGIDHVDLPGQISSKLAPVRLVLASKMGMITCNKSIGSYFAT